MLRWRSAIFGQQYMNVHEVDASANLMWNAQPDCHSTTFKEVNLHGAGCIRSSCPVPPSWHSISTGRNCFNIPRFGCSKIFDNQQLAIRILITTHLSLHSTTEWPLIFPAKGWKWVRVLACNCIIGHDTTSSSMRKIRTSFDGIEEEWDVAVSETWQFTPYPPVKLVFGSMLKEFR